MHASFRVNVMKYSNDTDIDLCDSVRESVLCVYRKRLHTQRERERDSQIKAYIRTHTLAPAQMTEIKIVADQNVTQNDGLSHKEL